jgi:hypothetical protein
MTNKHLVVCTRDSAEVFQEIDLWRIRKVDSKTVYWLLGIPIVRIAVTLDDGWVVQMASSGIGARSARSLAKALKSYVEQARLNIEEA